MSGITKTRAPYEPPAQGGEGVVHPGNWYEVRDALAQELRGWLFGAYDNKGSEEAADRLIGVLPSTPPQPLIST